MTATLKNGTTYRLGSAARNRNVPEASFNVDSLLGPSPFPHQVYALRFNLSGSQAACSILAGIGAGGGIANADLATMYEEGWIRVNAVPSASTILFRYSNCDLDSGTDLDDAFVKLEGRIESDGKFKMFDSADLTTTAKATSTYTLEASGMYFFQNISPTGAAVTATTYIWQWILGTLVLRDTVTATINATEENNNWSVWGPAVNRNSNAMDITIGERWYSDGGFQTAALRCAICRPNGLGDDSDSGNNFTATTGYSKANAVTAFDDTTSIISALSAGTVPAAISFTTHTLATAGVPTSGVTIKGMMCVVGLYSTSNGFVNFKHGFRKGDDNLLTSSELQVSQAIVGGTKAHGRGVMHTTDGSSAWTVSSANAAEVRVQFTDGTDTGQANTGTAIAFTFIGKAVWYMATAGPYSFTTAANLDTFGVKAWSNVNNCLVDDTSRASNNFDSVVGDSTQYLTVVNPHDDINTAIPDGSVITQVIIGIINRNAANAPGTNEVNDSRVRLIVGGDVQTDDQANATDWPQTDTEVEYTFVGSWTKAQITGDSFGVALSAINTADDGNNAATVDYIYLKEVTYTEPEVDTGGGDSGMVAALAESMRVMMQPGRRKR